MKGALRPAARRQPHTPSAPRRSIPPCSLGDAYLVRLFQCVLVRCNADDKAMINRAVPQACKSLRVVVSQHGALIGSRLEWDGRHL